MVGVGADDFLIVKGQDSGDLVSWSVADREPRSRGMGDWETLVSYPCSSRVPRISAQWWSCSGALVVANVKELGESVSNCFTVRL